MKTNQHARAARAYLDELCRLIDRGQRPRRIHRAWWLVAMNVPVAVSLAFGGGCQPNVRPHHPGGAGAEVCDDGVDNDGDGWADCQDPACSQQCQGPAYAAPGPFAGPTERDCRDGLDDDGDGRVDCYDEDCTAICSGAEYAAPVSGRELDCFDGQDNDGDGTTDCGDVDCTEYCPGAEYAAPAPIAPRETACNDGIDNDGDGRVDGRDEDCVQDAVALYAAPLGR